MSKSSSKSPQQADGARQVFRSVPQELYLRTLTISSRLSRNVDELLRTFDISQPQYNVLRILAGAGPKGLGRDEIASRMITTTPDMTRLLNRMVDKGWIRRERSAEDRREVPTTLTTAGQQLLKQIDGPISLLHERQFDAMNEEESRRLLKLLTRLST